MGGEARWIWLDVDELRATSPLASDVFSLGVFSFAQPALVVPIIARRYFMSASHSAACGPAYAVRGSCRHGGAPGCSPSVPGFPEGLRGALLCAWDAVERAPAPAQEETI